MRLVARSEDVHSLIEQKARLVTVTEGADHRIILADRADAAIGRTMGDAFPDLIEHGLSRHLDQAFCDGRPAMVQDLASLDDVDDESPKMMALIRPVRGEGGRISGLVVEFRVGIRESEPPLDVADLLRNARTSAVGTLASSIAHELSQPLTAIGNYAAGIRRALKQPVRSGKSIEKGIEAILESTAVAGEILAGVRALNRRAPAVRKRLDWEAMMRDTVIPVLGGDIRATSFRQDFSALRNCVIRADAAQLGQLLITLIRNACEAVRDRPDPAVIVTGAMREGDLIQVSVEDNGPGIAAKLLPILFDALSSADVKAAGFGMAVGRSIVEAHGGTIWAENRKNGGAAVHFSLPF